MDATQPPLHLVNLAQLFRDGPVRTQRRWIELAALRGQGISPQAPRKQLGTHVPRTKVVVEPAPSHDGSTTFAAYSLPVPLLPADPDSEDGYSNGPPTTEPKKHRPIFGIRIYDMASDATVERAAVLARRVSELTRDDHSWEQALEGTTDVGGEALYGRFLRVRYDRTRDESDSEDEDKPRREFFVVQCRLEQLGSKLSDFRGFRGNVHRFYQTHFIPDRVLDKELAPARAPAAGVEVPRPVVTPYYERENW
ncbi:hypothetical protein N657DRAFT_686531 [Parathielavia appendiculata]|uniref:Uncharacterized protein n=1 Tax=Parathielavia appendiculata TaxID=2587402 RepID=A0AAN6U9Y0_9PEZI|nr:hypothetical protein N657DRAFT_686531 [Parathielavia appendiculata]